MILGCIIIFAGILLPSLKAPRCEYNSISSNTNVIALQFAYHACKYLRRTIKRLIFAFLHPAEQTLALKAPRKIHHLRGFSVVSSGYPKYYV